MSNTPSFCMVTGAAGFIGYHLAVRLSQKSSNLVYVVENFGRGEKDDAFLELISRENVKLFEGDLTDTNFVKDLPPVDYLYHLASINGTENFYKRPFDVIEAASKTTLNLIKRYSEIGMKKFVLSSTSETYASTLSVFDWELPTAENVPLSIANIENPRWSYAAGKIASEAAVLAAQKQFGYNVAILRYHNVYGPRMGLQHVIPQFVTRAKSGIFQLYGHQNKRCFLYVEDAVRATEMIALSGAHKSPIFHLGTQEEVTMEQLANLIMNQMGVHGEVEFFPPPEGSVMQRIPNTQKFTRIFGDQMKTSLRDGLIPTVAYYLELE